MDLDKLLFYSFPGGILLAGLLVAFPNLVDTMPAGLWLASAPLLGFVFHSFQRTIFDLSGGYRRSKREVIKLLPEVDNEASAKDESDVLYKRWEMQRYSGDFPDKLATHIKRTWHFAHGLCTCVYAAVFSAVLLGVRLTPIYPEPSFAPLNVDNWQTMIVVYWATLVGISAMWANLMYLNEEIHQLEASIYRFHGKKLFCRNLPDKLWKESMSTARRRGSAPYLGALACLGLAVVVSAVPFWLSVYCLENFPMWRWWCLFIVSPGVLFISFCALFSWWHPRLADCIGRIWRLLKVKRVKFSKCFRTLLP